MSWPYTIITEVLIKLELPNEKSSMSPGSILNSPAKNQVTYTNLRLTPEHLHRLTPGLLKPGMIKTRAAHNMQHLAAYRAALGNFHCSVFGITPLSPEYGS